MRALRLVLPLIVSVTFVGTEGAEASPESDLAAAESSAAAAEEAAGTATGAQRAAEARLAKVAPKAAQANEEAAAAAAEVEAIEAEITAERTAAAEEVASIEKGYEDDKGEYDTKVSSGLGLGLGAAILAAIAFLWGRFRTLPVVGWLAERSWLAASGAVVGGGLVVTLGGGGLVESDAVAAAALGGFLITMGIGLPIALLLARHSLRVERGAGQPLFSRERLPRWVAVAVGVLLAFLFVGGLGDALTAEEPAEPEISAEQRELAEAASGDPLDPPTDELLATRNLAAPVLAQASELESARQEAQAALGKATSELRRAQRQLASAEAQIASATRRISRQAALSAPVPSSGDSGSSGSYGSCATAPSNIPVPPGSDLDGDGDGIGCEE